MPKEILTLQKLLTTLNTIAPFTMAEPWDNVGLMVGDPDQPVNDILVALDPTPEVITEAAAKKINTIITHHPLIFTPLKKIQRNTPQGHMLAAAIQNDIAIIACHTNLDLINQGVSNAVAEQLGLIKTMPLTNKEGQPETTPPQTGAGFGKIGQLPAPLNPEQFLTTLFSALSTTSLNIAGTLPQEIHTVALCGGSGSDLAETAFAKEAQVYITGEIKHSVARWSEANNFCIIDAGHYATENHIVPVLTKLLQETLQSLGHNQVVQATDKQSNPFQCVILHENKPLYS
jgi:dinuclear metal center YbgI/SA1388 family protein